MKHPMEEEQEFRKQALALEYKQASPHTMQWKDSVPRIELPPNLLLIMKATTLKAAAAALAAHNLDLVKKSLHRDRDWLWLEGDYREDADTRQVLKDTGFRFARKGHELDNGDTAHWYFAEGYRGRKRRRGPRPPPQAQRAAPQASKPQPKEAGADLFCTDPDAEFDALFN